MEYDNHYASNGKGNLGVTLGSIGVGLGVLSGGLGNILGGGAHNCNCSSDNAPVNRYEAAQQARISELETEVKLRDANTFTMSEMGKLRDYMETRFTRVENEICDQKAYLPHAPSARQVTLTYVDTYLCCHGMRRHFFHLIERAYCI